MESVHTFVIFSSGKPSSWIASQADQKFPKLGIGELVGFPLDRGEVKFILKEVIYFSENSRHARKKHISQSFS